MKFLLDHDVPETVIPALTHLGHEIVRVREALTGTATDPQVLEYARQQNLILISCNRDDFLALAERETHAGIIILIRRKTRTSETTALLRLLEKAGETGIRQIINFA